MQFGQAQCHAILGPIKFAAKLLGCRRPYTGHQFLMHRCFLLVLNRQSSNGCTLKIFKLGLTALAGFVESVRKHIHVGGSIHMREDVDLTGSYLKAPLKWRFDCRFWMVEFIEPNGLKRCSLRICMNECFTQRRLMRRSNGVCGGTECLVVFSKFSKSIGIRTGRRLGPKKMPSTIA